MNHSTLYPTLYMSEAQLSADIYMMSNRQPWVFALTEGLISCKTRNAGISLPKAGSTVFLHASKAMWSGWKNLCWVQHGNISSKDMVRGAVVGLATVLQVGKTKDIMPFQERLYFDVIGRHSTIWNCAAEQTIRFGKITLIDPIYCNGALRPVRKLPHELQDFVDSQRELFNTL